MRANINDVIIGRIRPKVYDYFLCNYDDEDLALQKSETIAIEIGDLVDMICYNFDLEETENTLRYIHTLKHLLLYADLDDVSDMCQDLELIMRGGIFNHELKDAIVLKIVK